MFDNKNLYIGAYILNKNARSKKHIKDIKRANIDFIVSIGYTDTSTLDLFKKYSLGAIVNGVFPSWWGSDGENSGQMSRINPIETYKKCIESYKHRDSIWGIDIGDEISSLDFEYINKIYEKNKDFFKDKMLYVNLYPNYALNFKVSKDERKKQWGCNSYQEYIEKYCEKIPLPYICFDHYPYSHGDILFYIDNLKIVKETADKYKKRVYLVCQSSSYNKDVFINKTQLRTQIYTALAFGIDVIMWACYSPGWWHNHILDESGNKTELYKKIKKVNCEAKKFYKKFCEYDFSNTLTLSGKTHFLSEINSTFKNIKPLYDGLYIVSTSDKKDAIYVVNATQNNTESTLSFMCKKTPKLYSMDKKCKLKYDKLSKTYLLNLRKGYGAIIKI